MYNYREPETHYNIVILKQCERGRIWQGILPFKLVYNKFESHVGMCKLIKNCVIQSAAFFPFRRLLSRKRKILSSGGSKGGRSRRAPPPRPEIFSFSCSFWGKFGKIVCWRPLLEGWRPLLRGILDPPLLSTKCFQLQSWNNKTFNQPCLLIW